MAQIIAQTMNLSLFWIGVLFTISGISASAYFFVDAEKTSEPFALDTAQTKSIKKVLSSQDIGFFKTYTPDFEGGAVFVQIADQYGNIIADKKIQTKMAINYFDIDKSGTYTVKATNLSQNSIYFELEFGQTNSQQIMYPAIVIVAGMILVIVSSYRKLQYSTA